MLKCGPFQNCGLSVTARELGGGARGRAAILPPAHAAAAGERLRARRGPRLRGRAPREPLRPGRLTSLNMKSKIKHLQYEN